MTIQLRLMGTNVLKKQMLKLAQFRGQIMKANLDYADWMDYTDSSLPMHHPRNLPKLSS